MFETRIHQVNGQSIHAGHAGPPDGPVMLMLHGFPEFRAAWEEVAVRFADDHHVVLPDQRGCGASSKPPAVEDYAPKHLAADMIALAREVSPDRPVILCGHDWGASVAYAVAFREPELVSHLVIANGVHPMTFQRALLADGPQRAASQYITTLRDPGSTERMAADSFARTFRMFEKFSSAPWLDEEIKARYRAVWEDALPTMIHWYRATPIEVPPPDAPAQAFPFTDERRERFRVRCPHLLMWGMEDTALLPDAWAGLGEFADDLTIHELDDASHWLLHEKPDAVARVIREWLMARAV